MTRKDWIMFTTMMNNSLRFLFIVIFFSQKVDSFLYLFLFMMDKFFYLFNVIMNSFSKKGKSSASPFLCLLLQLSQVHNKCDSRTDFIQKGCQAHCKTHRCQHEFGQIVAENTTAASESESDECKFSALT
mmetsp:Transcript_113748/g.232737  ORF Transcript_113748/g.232737 Transcript_113748/m.232737 type:complete len:130 (+) Transcript_113748:208-597(+)